MPESFLRGIRVLDLSQYIPGPYASLQLADLGADVIKVEPPAGDPMRLYGAGPGESVSPLYGVMNNGKRILRLDLKSESGKQALWALLREADVLIESYRPGTLAKLGFGRAELATANPGLIHCSISSYGKNGAYALKAAHDLNCMALGGGLAISGTVERPVITTPPVADYASALQATTTILAALAAKPRKGCFIDLSMTDSVLAWQAWIVTDSLRGGGIARRGAADSTGGLANYNVYETADGRFVVLGADEDKFWRNFCEAVGHAEWVARKYEPVPQARLIDEVATMFMSQPLSYWNALLDPVDCCYEPVLEPAEAIRHPQIAARQVVVEYDDNGPAAEILYPAWIDGKPPQRRARYAEADAEIGDSKLDKARMTEAPPVIYQTGVSPDWIDYNGHMTEWAYILIFGEAVNVFLQQQRIGRDYLKATGCTVYTLANQTHFLREVPADGRVSVNMQLLDLDDRLLHYVLAMRDDTGSLAAIQESVIAHVSQSGGAHATSFPADAKARLSAILERDRTLPRPRRIGQPIGIRRGQA